MRAENIPEPNDVPKTVDRLLALWSHQNTLLWSRLQTLAGLQIPVLGGWYFFWTNNRWLLAVLIAFLGVVLSVLIWELIHCDASRRDYLRNRVAEIDLNESKNIFPENKHRFVRGLTVMKGIVGMFFLIDFALTCFAAAKLF